MPHIGAIMARSVGEERGLKEAMVDLLVRSVRAAMGKRDAASTASSVTGTISDVRLAFSSWDNCMKATFCKWPVIAIIVVGGLFILSIVWCMVRCLCCGMSCCCSCFKCLKCCGDCCGMCTSPEKKHKHLDDPFMPTNNDHGYRSQAPMTAGNIAPSSFAKPEPPQYAEFETPKKVTGDELPVMPSWDGASSKKVAIEDDAVELEQLKKPETAQNVPLMAVGAASQPASPNPMSPRNFNSPYGQGQAGMNGYSAAPNESDPYLATPNGQGYGGYNGGYDPTSPGTGTRRYDAQGYDNQGFDNQGYDNQGYDNQGYDNKGYNNQGYDNQGFANQGYGMAAGAVAGGAVGGAAAAAMSQGRRTPHQDYDNGAYGRRPADQGYPQSRTPRPQDDYGRNGTPRGATPRGGTPGNGGYGRPPPRRPTLQGNDGYGNPERTQSPASRQGGWERSQTSNSSGRPYASQPQRQYSSDSTRPLARQAPERQYSETQYSEAQSPIQNSAGFDFTSGYSRPDTAEQYPSSGPQQTSGSGGSGYPGYRSYKAPGQH